MILKTVLIEEAEAVRTTWNLDGIPPTPEEAERQVERMHRNHLRNAEGDFCHLCLAMVLKEDGRWIGWCGLDNRGQAVLNPVIFYLLKRAFWSKGFATEAARALIDFTFLRTSIPQIHGGCAFDNAASKRVMEKIGMKYQGLDQEGGHSFTLQKEDWKESAIKDP